MIEIAMIRTGTANLAAVRACLQRLGAEPRLVESPEEVGNASGVILPGVGAFAAARKTLTEQGWDAYLRERIEKDQPTLAICLGLQLLCQQSEESPGVDGLGIIPERIEKFSHDLAIPQLGWNRISISEKTEILQEGYVYFANSYRLASAPSPWKAAYADYGERFVAAVEYGRVVACQFHPELSGALGAEMLQRWLCQCKEVASC